MSEQLTAQQIYDMGKQYGATSTVSNKLIIRGASGSFIYGDLIGKNVPSIFLDFTSQVGCNAIGHGHLAILDAIDKQSGMELLHSCGNDWFNEQAVLLMKKLCEITPGDSLGKKVFLSNSGTESVEAAVKFCKARRRKNGEFKRERFLSFHGAFHGRSGFALSLNCSKKVHTAGFFHLRDDGDLSFGQQTKDRAMPVSHICFPHKYDRGSTEDFKAFLDILFLENVNAIFIELVQGEGGIRVIDHECLNLLVEKCRKNNVYIVVDEVQTGLMRTGKMFACDHYKLEPDIICIAKALSGGAIPIGATVVKKEFDFEPGQHSNTFGGNPLACRVALALINELEKINAREFFNRIGILEEFAPQGLGMMRRVVFDSKQRRDQVLDLALDNLLLLIGAGEKAIRLMPPLNISEQHLRLGINILKKCM
ncbi:MAG: aminotransferase class III-fold pyridoxal phosphate-dependent enzyme [Patescibacteria group bacterium]